WRPDFLVLVILVSAANWGAGALASRFRHDKPTTAQTVVATAIVFDLGVLGYFKYFNFGVESLNTILSLTGLGTIAAWEVVLPVGISFYVFQAMSYTIDVYRGDAPPARHFVDMAAYIALFPQLVAGPILRYKDLADQLREPDYRPAGLSYGVRRFIVGFCRKVLIADAVAPIATAAFALTTPTAADAWLGVLAYSVQLYFDFSGYSDMAVGLGHMMGFTFMENFDAPYRSSSITEFWRRWHISLSTWLRDYLYVPLGGNRGSIARTYLNLALVMTIGGLWHGASWNFVLWGAWHGAWLCIERLVRTRSSSRQPIPAAPALGWLRTQLVVAFGWVLFRAPDLPSAGRVLAALARRGGFAPGADMAWRTGSLELAALAAGVIYLVMEPRASARTFASHLAAGSLAVTPGRWLRDWRPAVAATALAIAFLAATIKLSADSYSPFLYFQF
ncbi:MAG: MBOAT family protein, partial [Spirochaetales bacterium]|nr:MBOAT family protein [Spirochaetales bacterium]